MKALLGCFCIDGNSVNGLFEFSGSNSPNVQLLINGSVKKPSTLSINKTTSSHYEFTLHYPFKNSDFVEIYVPSSKTYLNSSSTLYKNSGFIQEPTCNLRVGVGLVTYNRIDYVKGFIEAFNRFDKANCVELVVADDGSNDDTAIWCKENKITVVTGRNKGVAWNKNRALYYLSKKELDVVLLIEDDCWPNDPFWMKAWANTVENYQHVNFGHPVILKANKDSIVSGDGSSSNAFLSKLVTGQCTGISLAALQKIGFLDTRFKGFGGAHVEWSYRFNKIYPVTLNDQKSPQLFATYRGGLIENDAPTFRDEEQVARNRKLRKKLSNDSVFKKPWRNLFEKVEFLLEQSKA